MAEKDFQLFLEKVAQLQQMVDSLDRVKGRKELLVACETHEDVVELAKEWGYRIGRRWGDHDQKK